ncbi:MAG: H-NS histone family protein [Proteobacteria bacterium]|nr:H-NS histone family protein [Pseudomonadota bacterium]
MSELLRIMSHSRRLKSAVKELSTEQLEDIKEKLQAIIEERISEEALEKQENQERLEKIKKYRELLAADGINPDELTEHSLEKTGKRRPRQPKYEVWNEVGERITWTGQGRMPNVFKARIDSGEQLDTFLIE